MIPGNGDGAQGASDAARADNVDMLAQAREAQFSAQTFLGEDAIRLVAPAKVNVFLGVGERLDSGYHEVQTVMHALSLHDVMYVAHSDQALADAGPDVAIGGPDGNVRVRIEMVDKSAFAGAGGGAEGGCAGFAACRISAHDNLVFKAIDLFARKTGFSCAESLVVRVEKHIPPQAGLGGGSADAAAALLGAAHFWGIADNDAVLNEVASALGADVAFFLEGGCGHFDGLGERLVRRLEPMKLPLVIVKPKTGISTPSAYAAFDKDPQAVPTDLLARVSASSRACEVPMFNNLSCAAEFLVPELSEVHRWLASQKGVLSLGDSPDKAVLLSGSGSATFAVVETCSDALRISAAANAHGWWARPTTFSPLRAAKVS